jgi:acyl transferase domain-containing protein
MFTFSNCFHVLIDTKIPTKLTKWPTEGLRRISINSFGFGGTNAHVVIDDAFYYLKNHGLIGNTFTSPIPLDIGLPSATNENESSVEPIAVKNSCRLLVLSAADEKSLNNTRDGIVKYYRKRILGGPVLLDDLVYTLLARRSSLAWRCYAVVDSTASDLGKALMMSKPHRSSQHSGIAFIFTGQGAEYTKMGIELLQFPVYRAALEKVDNIITKLGCKWSVLEKLKSWESISQAQYSQPICTALQIALVDLLKSLEILPVAVVGHSSGEIAAAYCTGALSIESACKVSYYRGLLASRMTEETAVKGAMMSINLAYDAVPGYLRKVFTASTIPPNLKVACINSPNNVTVSGDEDAIDTLKQALEQDAIFAMKLSTGIAYHSPAMGAIAAEYGALIGVLKPCVEARPLIPMISTVTGSPVAAATIASAEYWVENLLSPVLFDTAMTALISSNEKTQDDMSRSKPIYELLEIGPHAALRRPCHEILEQHARGAEVRYNSVLWRNASAMNTVLDLVGTLYTHGYAASAIAANRWNLEPAGSLRCLVDLPKYPFNHTQHYWHESRISRDYRLRVDVPKSVLGVRCVDWNPLQPRWRKIISTKDAMGCRSCSIW